MTIREMKMDLFNVPQGYYLAHCITGDFSLGAGIAKKIDEVYNMREKLFHIFGIFYDDSYHVEDDTYLGESLCVDNVFNIVLKKRPSKKAKYKRLRSALTNMRDIMDDNLITKLAIPKLGCGHEGLEWNRVKEIIKEVFSDTDVDILVCSLDDPKYEDATGDWEDDGWEF